MSKKGDETKKTILEAAEILFAQKGFKDVSMSDICAKTGLSRGGLYRHYSSTADIFRELLGEEYSFENQISRKDSAKTILLNTLEMVEKAIVHSEKSLSLAIYEYANIGDNKKEFLELEQKARKRWIMLIEYGIQNGEFRDIEAGAAAEMILYYYQGLRMWSRVVNVDMTMAVNYRNNVISLLCND